MVQGERRGGRRRERVAVATAVTLAPVPVLAHGEQFVFQIGYLPFIIATGAYLVSLAGSTWDRKAKIVAAIAVVGTSAALTLSVLVCFGVFRPLECFYPFSRIGLFAVLTLQFTAPYVLWAGVRWWAHRTGRAGPRPVGRVDGW
jgi:hypothetical protein